VPDLTSYLLLFNSAGQASYDPIVAKYFSFLSGAQNIGCVGDIIVYNLSSGSYDPRWGLFIAVPSANALLNHPNTVLAVSSSAIIENSLGSPLTNFQFIANGWGVYPLRIPPIGIPPNVYVTEDGVTPYVAEDGTTVYVQEV
jgi:hypothetical protein